MQSQSTKPTRPRTPRPAVVDNPFVMKPIDSTRCQQMVSKSMPYMRLGIISADVHYSRQCQRGGIYSGWCWQHRKAATDGE